MRFLGVLSGITLYWAKDNATYLKEQAAKVASEADRIARGPRLLPAHVAKSLGLAAKAAGLSILVIQLGDPEARNYASQFITALTAADVPVQVMPIGMMATYGVEVWGGGPEVEQLLWPAAGLVDTEIRFSNRIGGFHATTSVQPRVQA